MNLSRGLAALSLLACASVVTLAQNPAGPLPMPKLQFFDSLGRPLAGGKVYTYAAGTSTLQGTYTDAGGAVFNTNPIILDAGGMAAIWVKTGVYKIIVQDSNGVQQWTADNVSNTGQYIFGGLGGFATLDGSGRLPASQLTLYGQGGTGAVLREIGRRLQDSVSVKDFGALGDGVTNDAPAINRAYAALPTNGGTLYFPAGTYAIAAGLVFGTNHKYTQLRGDPGGSSRLLYTASTGTAVTLDYGSELNYGAGLNGITITGPGYSTTTIGVLMGFTNSDNGTGGPGAAGGGSEGSVIENCLVQNFGTGIQMGPNTWNNDVQNCTFRQNGRNVYFPDGGGSVALPIGPNVGYQMRFDHCEFEGVYGIVPTDSVVIRGGGNEVLIRDSNFNGAQVHLGSGALNGSKLTISGTHFENDNAFMIPGLTTYPYIRVDSHQGNVLSVHQSEFFQNLGGATSWNQSELILADGGSITLFDNASWVTYPSVTTNLVTANGSANVTVQNFNDLSGQIANLVGGTSTGFMWCWPGQNAGAVFTRNFGMGQGVGACVGGALFEIDGVTGSGTVGIKTNKQFSTTVATGTAPLSINSTTPVNNLFSSPVTYDAGGNQLTGRVHLVAGNTSLSGGAATVNLSGSAVFTNASSFDCSATDRTAAAAVRATPVSGTQFTLAGTGVDGVSYSCLGF